MSTAHRARACGMCLCTTLIRIHLCTQAQVVCVYVCVMRHIMRRLGGGVGSRRDGRGRRGHEGLPQPNVAPAGDRGVPAWRTRARIRGMAAHRGNAYAYRAHTTTGRAPVGSVCAAAAAAWVRLVDTPVRGCARARRAAPSGPRVAEQLLVHDVSRRDEHHALRHARGWRAAPPRPRGAPS